MSNAGAIWPVNVGRILKAPLLNYGFSGSCLMQLPVAEQLGAATFNGGRQCENAPLLLLYIRESGPMFMYIYIVEPTAVRHDFLPRQARDDHQAH